MPEKWISKAFRHSNSLQIVIPKPLLKLLGWGFNTHFILEQHSPTQAIITSIDDYVSKPSNREVNYNMQAVVTPVASGPITLLIEDEKPNSSKLGLGWNIVEDITEEEEKI